MTNVLEFPKNRIVRENNIINDDAEDAKAKKEEKIKFANLIVYDVLKHVVEDFENYGIDFNDDSYDKDFEHMIMSIKSAVYRTMGLNHFMHDWIDENSDFIGMDEEMEDFPA